MRRIALASLALAGSLASCSLTPLEPRPAGAGALLIVAPPSFEPNDPRAEGDVVPRLVDEASKYLSASVGTQATVVRRKNLTLAEVETLAREQGAGLVVVLDASRVVPERVPRAEIEALPIDSFRLETEERGTFPNALGDQGATIVLADGHGPLGDQYAVYEVARRLGARFYHPEDELVPRLDAGQVRARARAHTRVAKPGPDGRPSRDYVPDFTHRSYSFHGAHPLEHMEAFSDARHPIDEAARVNEWIVKNRGDFFRGAGRGVAPPEAAQQRRDELEALRRALGMRRSTGITLHNEQQGASADLDPSSPVPIQVQIETLVEERLAATPDATHFGIHFGPTEFTVTPDQETVQWLDWAGRKVKELRPDLGVLINDHTTGSQPTPNFDDRGCPTGTNAEGRGDYYDLAFHTDPALGVNVHTVMFYPLEGPAHVYNQVSFAHKLCLMEKASLEGRPISWFPEGSWWLSFDNPVPVYLPLYIGTRGRDVELVRHLLRSRHGGTLEGHRMFNSGHEWGYWQQDYAVGMWHWNADASQDDVLAELTDGFCDTRAWPTRCAAQLEGMAVLRETIEHQGAAFLEAEDFMGRPGGLYAYFAGEDPADEIAAVAGFEFRPVRLAFRDVLGLSDELASALAERDVTALYDAELVYGGLHARLEAVRDDVPAAGLPYLGELMDGLAINELRARHTALLYEAALALRDGDAVGASALTGEAGLAMSAAETVIRRRESQYRYPPAQVYGGGLTPATAVPNGTTYPYRVHTKTHLLTYWRYRQDQLEALVAGELEPSTTLTLAPVFADPGEPLTLSYPEFDDLSVSIELGDGTVLEETAPSHDYPAGEGIYPVSGTMVLGGQTIPIAGAVARTARRGRCPEKGIDLVVPNDSLAESVVSDLAPAFQLALTDGALAVAPERDGALRFDTVVVGAIDAWAGASFVTEPVDLVLPIENGSAGTTLPLRVVDAVFGGEADAAGFVAGVDGARVVHMDGALVVHDVVVALIELAGFDEVGAYQTLSGVLGFDASNPPETVPFVADFVLEAAGE